MKKILLLAVFLFPAFAFAEDNYINGVEEPQWKDFAPPAFADVQEPKGVGKFNDTTVYWYKRRVEFESGIEICREKSLTEEKVACYQKLKVKQYAKNSNYNARLEAIDNEKRMPQEMQDPTTNMLPIGGAIGNFMRYQPNEFR